MRTRGGVVIRRWGLVVAIAASTVLLAACGRTAPTTTTMAPTTIAFTRLLAVTPAVRQSLLAAGAALHHLPAKDYVGLAAGTTYYAYDPSTATYYAAAGLVASQSSLAAQVGTQDDGAYNLFVRKSGTAAWTVYNDGLGGVQGARCPIVLPAAVIAVWHWRAHSCYPSAPG
jgi:predicted lipoprotein with Yx(FWY)xxD motif